MATVYSPPFRHLRGGLRDSIKPAPWLSPFRLPNSRRASEVRYAFTSKCTTTKAPKIRAVTLYVDASGTGIGMKLGKEGSTWQRWILNRTIESIPRSPATEKIDPNWVELLAVYTGLQTVVEGGVCGCRISLYSDNKGVVDTLRRFADTHPSLWGTVGKPPRLLVDLLKRIGEVCDKHGLEIEAQWLPTEKNPAVGQSVPRKKPGGERET